MKIKLSKVVPEVIRKISCSQIHDYIHFQEKFHTIFNFPKMQFDSIVDVKIHNKGVVSMLHDLCIDSVLMIACGGLMMMILCLLFLGVDLVLSQTKPVKLALGQI